MDFGLQVLDSGFLDSRAYCRLQLLVGFRIPNRLNTGYQDLYEQKFLGFDLASTSKNFSDSIWLPQTKISRISESGLPLIHFDTRGDW